jgi:hypothetical protein
LIESELGHFRPGLGVDLLPEHFAPFLS